MDAERYHFVTNSIKKALQYSNLQLSRTPPHPAVLPPRRKIDAQDPLEVLCPTPPLPLTPTCPPPAPVQSSPPSLLRSTIRYLPSRRSLQISAYTTNSAYSDTTVSSSTHDTHNTRDTDTSLTAPPLRVANPSENTPPPSLRSVIPLRMPLPKLSMTPPSPIPTPATSPLQASFGDGKHYVRSSMIAAPLPRVPGPGVRIVSSMQAAFAPSPPPPTNTIANREPSPFPPLPSDCSPPFSPPFLYDEPPHTHSGLMGSNDGQPRISRRTTQASAASSFFYGKSSAV